MPTSPAEFLVGVTGHRDLSDADLVALRRTVAAALQELIAASRGRTPVLCTGLAEGADQLVAEVAQALGMKIRLILPAEENSYVAAFQTERDRDRYWSLRPEDVHRIATQPCDEKAYPLLAVWISEQCDALIALWTPARDVGTAIMSESEFANGGTRDVVTRAWGRALPWNAPTEMCRPMRVLHVDPVNAGSWSDAFSQKLEVALGHVGAPYWMANSAAKREQDKMRSMVGQLALLAATAVALATTGILLEGVHGGELELHGLAWLIDAAVIACAMLEVGVLVAAKLLVFRHGQSRHRDLWAQRRTRAEVLKAECYLWLTGSGPYATSPTPAGADLEARVGALCTQWSDARAVECAELTGEIGDPISTRLAEVWVPPATNLSTPVADWTVREFYLRHRIGDQNGWFQRRAEDKHVEASKLERRASLALVVALGGAIVHLGVVAAAPVVEAPQWLATLRLSHFADLAAHVAVFAAIVGPTIASAVEMVLNFRHDRTSARHYLTLASTMRQFGIAARSSHTPTSALVEKVETVLLSEHAAWRAQILAEEVRSG